MNRLFCFGMGFCAKALSQNLAPRGWAIGASTRGPVGYQSFPFDSGLSGALHGTTHVLISAPPEGEADPVLAMHAATLSAMFVDSPPQWPLQMAFTESPAVLMQIPVLMAH